MSYENHMGFIYSGFIPDIRCAVCGKVIVSCDGKEINPGRKMHKDEEMENRIPIFGKHPIIKRKTVIVCPEHQVQLEKKGYYFAAWWSKDGIIHGTK